MPTYQYRCQEYDTTFERTETISEHEAAKPMPKMWEHEGFCCTSAYLRGDVKEELKGTLRPNSRVLVIDEEPRASGR